MEKGIIQIGIREKMSRQLPSSDNARP